MTEQESGLVTAIKNHIILWAAILTCIGLLVNFLSMKFLLDRIDSVRCSCTNMRVESSGNHTVTNVHVPNENPIDQRVREILSKKEETDARLSKPLPVKSNSGS